MNDLLGVTVDDLIASLKSRRVRIPSEIGAFITLEICESLLLGPAAIGGGDVRIGEDGVVSVFATPDSASAEEAARSVCAILASLLVAAGAGVPGTLMSIVEDGPSQGPQALERLRDDLEASLVPLNRGASRRVLARMIREARRASSRPDSQMEVPQERLDAALDDLLNAGPGSPPRSPVVSDPDLVPPSFASDSPADLSDPFADPRRPGRVAASPAAASSPLQSPAAPKSGLDPAPPKSERALARERDRAVTSSSEETQDFATEQQASPSRAVATPAPPSKAKPAGTSGARPSLDLDHFDEPKPERRGGSALTWVFAFVVVAAVGAAGVAVVRPDLVDLALGRPPPPPPPSGPSDQERAAALAAHRARFGTVTVHATPDRAQVLHYVGRGPVVIADLPVGVAWELVAIADGRAPTRAVVPADAQWEETESGLRYELAMQTGETAMDPDRIELGATRLEAGTMGSPSGSLGTLRVVTTPPGAKVYLVAGFTPDVTVQNVRTDEAVEILVYREGHAMSRNVVGPSDWVTGPDGERTAQLEITLTPLSRRR